MSRITQFAFIGVLSLAFSACTGKSKTEVHWDYEGKTSPYHWAELSQDYKICNQGHHQSPIDIHQDKVEKISQNLHINYHDSEVLIKNNSHTVEFDMANFNFIEVNRKRYRLRQFHFHAASEHTLDGKHYPAELHLVHQAQDGELFVLAVFLEQRDKGLDHIFDQLPTRGSDARVKIHLVDLLPQNRHRYIYDGSLTTPPCTENVTWIIFSNPVKISRSQLERFKMYYSHNFRPLQKEYLRKIFVAW